YLTSDGLSRMGVTRNVGQGTVAAGHYSASTAATRYVRSAPFVLYPSSYRGVGGQNSGLRFRLDERLSPLMASSVIDGSCPFVRYRVSPVGRSLAASPRSAGEPDDDRLNADTHPAGAP